MRFFIFFWAIMYFAHNPLNATPKGFNPPQQSGVLNVVQDLSIKDIFDSGLRPYLLTQSICTVGASDITFILPSNKSISLRLSRIGFNINKYDNVSRLDGQGPIMSLEDGENIVRKIVLILEGELQGFEDALARMKSDINSREIWERHWDRNNKRFYLNFCATSLQYPDFTFGSRREMKAVVNFTIEWNSKEIGPTFRTTPIIKPIGYEHISMEVPSSNLLIQAQNSNDPGLTHLKHSPEVWEKMLAENGLKPSPTPLSKPSPKPKQSPAVAAEIPSSSQSYAWLFALAAGLIMISLISLLKRALRP